jgi:hypothetical protein
MRSNEFIIEAIPVGYPITPKMVQSAKDNEMGFVYWASQRLVPDAVEKQRNARINKSVGWLLDAEACKFDPSGGSPDSQSFMITGDANNPRMPAEWIDDNGEYKGILSILECDYDTRINANGTIMHTIGVNSGYRGHTSSGFVTRVLDQIYKGLEILHGSGQRTLSINDDKGAGVWQSIMSKLKAIPEPD